MNEIKTEVALIKQEAKFIKEKIDTACTDLVHIKKALSGDLENPQMGFVRKKDLDSHARQDRYFFGTMITILLAILGKMIFHF